MKNWPGTTGDARYRVVLSFRCDVGLMMPVMAIGMPTPEICIHFPRERRNIVFCRSYGDNNFDRSLCHKRKKCSLHGFAVPEGLSYPPLLRFSHRKIIGWTPSN